MLGSGGRGEGIVASGVAALPSRKFLLGLTLGSLLFLSLHFFLGYLGGSALFELGRVFPLSTSIPLVIALLVAVYSLWVVTVRRQKAARAELGAAHSDLRTAPAL